MDLAASTVSASLKLMDLAPPRERLDPFRVDESRDDPPLDDRGERDAAGAPLTTAPLTMAPARFSSRMLPFGVLSLLPYPPGAGSSLWLSQSSLALFTGLLPLLIPAGFRSCALRTRKE